MLSGCLLAVGKRLPLLKPSYCQTVLRGTKREASTWWSLFRKRTPEAYARYDGLNPTRDQLVYTSGLHNYMLLASITATGIATSCACYVGATYFNLWPEHANGQTPIWSPSVAQGGAFVFVSGMYLLACLYLLRHMPLRIYYNKPKQSFCFVFQSIMPGLRRIESFKPGALETVPKTKYNSIRDFLGNLRVRNGRKRFVVVEERFHVVAFYNVLVGFDDVEVLES
uniref:Putative conserved plasma membrane protein n=1 Tax=Amblyomma aureolatum TaxID=187763 RepID=A0A1E1XBG0_9ACAR